MADKLEPSHFSLDFAIRPAVLNAPTYATTTSDQVSKRPAVVLDANENPEGNCLARPRWLSRCLPFLRPFGVTLDSLKRYPSSSQRDLKTNIARWRQLDGIESVCLGSGASDVLDLILRATCTPNQDKVLVVPPTFDLYKVRAKFYDIGVVECPLEFQDGDFVMPTDKICDTLASDQDIKLAIIASPGNPAGSLIPLGDIQRILDSPSFHGLLVIDEAYIDFTASPEASSAISLLRSYSNLVVVQSLSKAHGLAGIRVGMAFAHPIVTAMFCKLQMPYGISAPVLALATKALSRKNVSRVNTLVNRVKTNRAALVDALSDENFRQLGVGPLVGGNQANYVVVPILSLGKEMARRDDDRARAIAARLREVHGVGVRYVGHATHCEACLRVSVGTAREQKVFLKAFEEVLLVV
ncbi:histidinol-phosphate aminotransferase [Aspergillus ambiguus]|uniref:pyridoxal phosphate-dependent aminotransferase n=1 Tax=Aspergillus ambiguus TaxID=176160 RepID=UPI003CCDBD66